jgi:hypothetical protein
MPQELSPERGAHLRDVVAAFTAAAQHPSVLYWLCKDIDDYKGEGTFVVMGCRVLRRYWVYDRQKFYEPLSTYNHILEAQRLNMRLKDGGAPKWASNYFYNPTQGGRGKGIPTGSCTGAASAWR